MREIRAKRTDAQIRLALLVVDDFISRRLYEGALQACQLYGIPQEKISVVWAPGPAGIPLLAKKLAAAGSYDAIVCLGTLVQGEEGRDPLFCDIASSIRQTSLDTGIPLIFGGLSCETVEQALARAGARKNRGFEAVETALEMTSLCQAISPEAEPVQKKKAPTFSPSLSIQASTLGKV